MLPQNHKQRKYAHNETYHKETLVTDNPFFSRSQAILTYSNEVKSLERYFKRVCMVNKRDK